MREPEAQRLSNLVGAIYDSALDPARWPETLKDICAHVDGVASQLYMLDLDTGLHSFATGWGEAPEMTRQLIERYQSPSADWQRRALMLRGPDADPDEPFVLRRLPEAEELIRSEWFRGWAGTLGYCDAITSVVLKRGQRVGLLGVARHVSVGVATDREVALMRMLGPHLRRAAAIGDLLDMAALEAEALRGAMDGLRVGIGVVDGDGALLHANRAAEAMMRAPDGPIRSVRGRLASRRAAATAELNDAIAAAARSDEGLGGTGIGVVLRDAQPAQAPSVAHVLPLTGGRSRRGLVPRAAAAVFVSPEAEDSPDGSLDAALRGLNLTGAEARLARLLATGATLAEAREALGIAETTAKTHLAHIFAKAGVGRQSDLVALLLRLASPLRGR